MTKEAILKLIKELDRRNKKIKNGESVFLFLCSMANDILPYRERTEFAFIIKNTFPSLLIAVWDETEYKERKKFLNALLKEQKTVRIKHLLHTPYDEFEKPKTIRIKYQN